MTRYVDAPGQSAGRAVSHSRINARASLGFPPRENFSALRGIGIFSFAGGWNIRAQPGLVGHRQRLGDGTMASQFHDLLKEQLPRLRVMALAMTRDRSAADDLVQDAVVNTLSGQDSFMPGTNFGAWTYRIMRNHFISGKRRARATVDVDAAPAEALMVAPPHEDAVMAREVMAAIERLPLLQREALLMVSLGGLSYEEVAEHCACSIGTAKSRVCRARQHLQAILLGGGPAAVSTDGPARAAERAQPARAEPADFATGPLA